MVRIPSSLTSLVSLALLIGISACGRHSGASGTAPMAGVSPNWRYSGKARVTNAPSDKAVSGSPIASQVGLDILQRGGNAVDAAVAVGFALAVVHPEAGNLGGGGFMIIRPRDGHVHALYYRDAAPARASRDMYRAGRPESSVTGPFAAGVPGAVAGLV